MGNGKGASRSDGRAEPRLINGIWFFPDGTRIRAVSGGQEGDGSGSGSSGTEPNGQPNPGGEGQPSGGNQPAKTPTQEDLDKANAEAARYRKDLRATQGELETLKARLAELEGQGKSEADKLVDLKAKAEQERDQALADLKAERINNTVIAAAAKLKLTNPGLAPRLIDQTALEFDENGYPTNAEAVVQTLIQAEPYLVGATVPATQQATPATGQPNNGNGKALSMDDVAKMSETEINANWDAVQAALAAERARRRAGVA